MARTHKPPHQQKPNKIHSHQCGTPMTAAAKLQVYQNIRHSTTKWSVHQPVTRKRQPPNQHNLIQLRLHPHNAQNLLRPDRKIYHPIIMRKQLHLHTIRLRLKLHTIHTHQEQIDQIHCWCIETLIHRSQKQRPRPIFSHTQQRMIRPPEIILQ